MKKTSGRNTETPRRALIEAVQAFLRRGRSEHLLPSDRFALRLRVEERTGRLPENAEFEEALRTEINLFFPELLRATLRTKRRLGLKLLQTLFAPYDVRLTGAVLSGCVLPGEPVEFVVRTDDAKAFVIDLLNEGVTPESVGYVEAYGAPRADGRTAECLLWTLFVPDGEETVLVTVVSGNAPFPRGRKQLPTDNHPAEASGSADAATLEALLSACEGLPSTACG